MDFLECKICHVSYDEEDHQPRNAPCGHGYCTTCLKALINNSIFACPKCRKKHKVNFADDLPIHFDLIDVIQVFKAKDASLTTETESRVSDPTQNDVCNVHFKALGHWCFKCQIWLCDDCLDYHPITLGCSTTISTEAIVSMKEKNITNTDLLLNNFEEDANYLSSMIQQHTELAKKHEEKANKLRIYLEEGNTHKEKLMENKNDLNEAITPHAFSAKFKLLTQRKQILLSWSVKNKKTYNPATFTKTLKEDGNVYAEMIIKDEKRHAKIAHHEDSIYFHSFQAKTDTAGSMCMPFDRLQNMIPDEASLVFLELSHKGIVRGNLVVQLDKTLPHINECIVQIVTGEQGLSLCGTLLYYDGVRCMRNMNMPLSAVKVSPDRYEKIAKPGDVIGYFGSGYLQHIYFYIATSPNEFEFDKHHSVFGTIKDGLEVLKDCQYKIKNRVKISDCGLVINLE
ncbi:unnamed protein product [Meganyctiphanes norvegica]|uniref:RING-type domain-containing protein n=1 Tax=Meganyctiphanes norvegica TaxID=48144 RepID=A0AAV2SBG5_MEGNR